VVTIVYNMSTLWMLKLRPYVDVCGLRVSVCYETNYLTIRAYRKTTLILQSISSTMGYDVGKFFSFRLTVWITKYLKLSSFILLTTFICVCIYFYMRKEYRETYLYKIFWKSITKTTNHRYQQIVVDGCLS
jgi:hypothetical protein